MAAAPHTSLSEHYKARAQSLREKLPVIGAEEARQSLIKIIDAYDMLAAYALESEGIDDSSIFDAKRAADEEALASHAKNESRPSDLRHLIDELRRLVDRLEKSLPDQRDDI